MILDVKCDVSADDMWSYMLCFDRNALNVVKDDLIARVDELTRSVPAII